MRLRKSFQNAGIELFNLSLQSEFYFFSLLKLIYEFKDGGGSFGLLSLNPDELPSDDVVKFERIGVKIPSMM